MNHKPTRPTAGPRGGRAVQATPCAECVSWRSCRPAAISEPFGCESWVDQDGRRALPDVLEVEGVEDTPEPDWEARHRLRTGLLESHGGILHNPDPGPFLKNSEPDSRREGIYIPPVGGQPGRTVYGDFGPETEPEPILTNPDPEPEPFRPAEPYRPDQLRGEGPAQACLEMPDAGPLFAGCLEAKS